VTDSDAPNIGEIKARQGKRRATALGVMATALTASLGIIAQLVNMTRADAEKATLTVSAAEIREELASMRRDINSLTERITRTETKLDERVPKHP